MTLPHNNATDSLHIIPARQLLAPIRNPDGGMIYRSEHVLQYSSQHHGAITSFENVIAT